MQNKEGQNMDLYIPRKCSATNRLITSKDHASVQINVGHLDERVFTLASSLLLPSVVLYEPREMLTVHLTGCDRRRKSKLTNSYFTSLVFGFMTICMSQISVITSSFLFNIYLIWESLGIQHPSTISSFGVTVFYDD